MRDLMTVDEVISPSRGNCTILYRYATTTYAAQVVMLAALTYMFDRDDWQRAIQKASGTASLLASDNLVVTNNPFARKKPQQSSARLVHAEEAPAEGFVTGDF